MTLVYHKTVELDAYVLQPYAMSGIATKTTIAESGQYVASG